MRRSRHPLRLSRSLAFVAVLTFCLSACDDTFSPFTDDIADPPHVLDGLLDTSADTQFVRLQIVRREVNPVAPILNETELLSTNSSGVATVWQDSLVTLADGTLGHLFFSSFKPSAGEAYTFVALGPEGRHTSITRKIPVKPTVVASSPIYAPGSVTSTLLLMNIFEQPDDIRLEYAVVDPGRGDRTLAIPYNGSAGFRRPGGWEFTASLRGDRFAVAAFLGQNFLTPVRLRSVQISITEYGPEWKTRRAGDTGFLGAVGRYTLPLVFDNALLDSLNYVQ